MKNLYHKYYYNIYGNHDGEYVALLIECCALLILILTIFFLYLRMKKKEMALTILPLIGVPLTHILALLCASRLAALLSVDVHTFVTVLDIIGLAVSTLLCGSLSSAYGKRARWTYFIIVGLFNGTLTCVLLLNL